MDNNGRTYLGFRQQQVDKLKVHHIFTWHRFKDVQYASFMGLNKLEC